MTLPRPSTNWKIKLLSIQPSLRADKKWRAEFRVGLELVHIWFGARGYDDYIAYHKKDKALAQERRASYIARHGATELWTDPMKASTLSRYILWEYPTMREAIKEYKKRFRV